MPSCEGDGVFDNPSFPYRTGTLADAPSSDGVKTRKGEARALLGATGSVDETLSYGAFGATVSQTGAAATPFQYAGGYEDATSGLYYLINRYYDPATGQFLSADPLVNFTGQPYEYAQNDPVNSMDPLGLITVTDCYAAGGSVAHVTGSVALCFNFGWHGYSVTAITSGGVDVSGSPSASASDNLGVQSGAPPSSSSTGASVNGSASYGYANGSLSAGPCGSHSASVGLGVSTSDGADVSLTESKTTVLEEESWAQWRHDWYETIFHPSTDLEGREGWF